MFLNNLLLRRIIFFIEIMSINVCENYTNNLYNFLHALHHTKQQENSRWQDDDTKVENKTRRRNCTGSSRSGRLEYVNKLVDGSESVFCTE